MNNVVNFVYPLDVHGNNPANRIGVEPDLEIHTITAANGYDFQFLIPRKAPFFQKGCIVRNKTTGKELIEGSDYVLTHRFSTASLALSQPVYGSITFLNRQLAGVFTLEYQTLGGEYILDEASILTYLTNKQIDPRTTTWEAITDKPFHYEPIAHLLHADDIVGVNEIVAELINIRLAMEQSDSKFLKLLKEHIDYEGNPHKWDFLLDLNLDQLMNFPIANLEEAQLGIRNDRYSTPKRVADYVKYKLGNVKNWDIATDQEAKDGIVKDKYMTPYLSLLTTMEAMVRNNLLKSSPFTSKSLTSWPGYQTNGDYKITGANLPKDVGVHHVSNSTWTPEKYGFLLAMGTGTKSAIEHNNQNFYTYTFFSVTNKNYICFWDGAKLSKWSKELELSDVLKEIATDDEAKAGTVDNKLMTPLKTFSAILQFLKNENKLRSGPFTAHYLDNTYMLTGATAPTKAGVWNVVGSTWTPEKNGILTVTTNNANPAQLTVNSGYMVAYEFIGQTGLKYTRQWNGTTYTRWQSTPTNFEIFTGDLPVNYQDKPTGFFFFKGE